MESGVLFIAYIIIFNIPKVVALFDTEGGSESCERQYF